MIFDSGRGHGLMSFQISSQAASSSSRKATPLTRGKDVLKRVFRLGVDKEVRQGCVCLPLHLLKPACQAKTRKDPAERVTVSKREYDEV